MSVVIDKVFAFAKIYGADMTTAAKGSGIFFPVMLAQGSVESSYGKSPAALNKNNLFGIMATKKKVARFNSKLDSIIYYIHLFGRKDNYVQKNVLGQPDPYKQLRAIADAGYYSCNNDDPKSLPANLRAKYPHVSDKESADHYYNTIKPVIDSILLKIPIGRIVTQEDIIAANKIISTSTTNV
jgi:hypothetical protein